MSIANKVKQLFAPMDLTEGKPMKVIFIFMIPILLSLIFQQIYTISDAAIVGQTLSSEEVAGVNDVYGLFYIVIQFAFGCTAGFSVVTSNRAGADDKEGMRKSFAVQIALCLIISIILTVIVTPLTPYLLNLIGIKQGDGIYEYAYSYLLVIYIGLISQVFYNLAVSVLRSMGDSLSPLLFLIGSTILNIGMDFLFIMAFKWGVTGAAVATVIAQLLAALVSIIYIFVRYDFLRIKLSDFRFSFKEAYEHLKLGLPLAFQFSILGIGLIILQKAVISFDNGIGQDAQLGYGVAVKFNDFMMTPFNALGAACLSYQGQNYGAQDEARIKQGMKDSVILAVIFYLVIGSITCLLSIDAFYANIFLSSSSINDRVRFYASTYMYIDGSTYIFLSFLFVFRNSLQGLGKSIYPFISGVSELIGRVVIASFLPMWINPSDPTSDISFIGLCFSDCMAWVLAILVMSFGIYKYVIRGKIGEEFKKVETTQG